MQIAHIVAEFTGYLRRMALLNPILAVATASFLSVAQPTNTAEWSPNPEDVARLAPKGASIGLRLVVSPEGKVVQCTAEGDTALDKWICARALSKARFKPATNLEGQATFGVFEMGMRFSVPGFDLPSRSAKALWSVESDTLPDSVRTSAMFTMAILVTSNGVIAQCKPQRWEPALPNDLALQLGERACGELENNYKPEPARLANGEVVDSVHRIIFQFKKPVPS
mgnify:CR=1 FL=1